MLLYLSWIELSYLSWIVLSYLCLIKLLYRVRLYLYVRRCCRQVQKDLYSSHELCAKSADYRKILNKPFRIMAIWFQARYNQSKQDTLIKLSYGELGPKAALKRSWITGKAQLLFLSFFFSLFSSSFLSSVYSSCEGEQRGGGSLAPNPGDCWVHQPLYAWPPWTSHPELASILEPVILNQPASFCIHTICLL